jgi:hypothetical protein
MLASTGLAAIKRKAELHKQLAVFLSMDTENEKAVELVSRERHCALRLVPEQTRRPSRQDYIHQEVYLKKQVGFIY